MARIDKAWFVVRGIAGTALTGVIGVAFSTGGSVVPAGTTAALQADGVVCIPGTIQAGYPVGVLKEGEIVEFGGAAATAYYAGTNGSISTTATNSKQIGKTVEADRLVVHL